MMGFTRKSVFVPIKGMETLYLMFRPPKHGDKGNFRPKEAFTCNCRIYAVQGP
jgi:hypothetical protein